MPNVLIPNKSYHDFSSAEKYGNLIYMSEGPINKYQPNDMVRQFKPYIDASKPDDWILVSALPVMVAIISTLFAAKHGRLNLLLWKKEEGNKCKGEYISRILILEETSHV